MAECKAEGKEGKEAPAAPRGRASTLHSTHTAAEEPAVRLQRSRLAEGTPALLHTDAGLPYNVMLRLSADHEFIMMEPSRVCCRRANQAQTQPIAIGSVSTVVQGRYSENFARTVKYTSANNVLFSMESCVSVACGVGRQVDLEFSAPKDLDGFVETLALVREMSVAAATPQPTGPPSTPTADVPPELVFTTSPKPVMPPPSARRREWPRGGSGLSGKVYRVMYSPPVERFILFTIIVNIVVMALSSPGMSDGNYKDALEAIELACSIIFTVEMVARITALEGVCGYVADSWNVLDGVIVIGGWITELPFLSGLNFGAFRAFRAVRVLRTMKFLTGIREILDTFASTMPMVVQAMSMYFYFLLLFSALGIDLFGDVLNRQCAALPSVSVLDFNPYSTPGMAPVTSALPASPRRFCESTSVPLPATPTACDFDALSPACDVLPASGDRGLASDLSADGCPVNQVCMFTESPNSGFSGFDAFGVALNTVFRVSARPPGASFLFRGVMEGSHPAAIVFFIGILLFVSFLVLSLFVAIVRATFILVQRRKKQEEVLSVTRTAAAQRRAEAAAAELAAETGAEGGAPARAVAVTVTPVEVDTGEENARRPCCCRRPSRVCCVWFPSGNFVARIRALVSHPTFEHVVMFMILANTVLLAMEYHGMEDTYQKTLSLAQFALTVAFAIEMGLKIIGLGGVCNYCFVAGTGWNRFDAVVVIVTVIDLVVTLLVGGWSDVETGESSGSVNLSLLRVFRVLRVVRLVRRNQDLAKLLNAIISSMGDLINLLTFMTLVIMVFAIMGMQLFGDKLGDPPPRAHFDNFGSSMLTLFRLMSSGGSWGIYFTLLESSNDWAAPPYFLAYAVFASYITLNFLIVIILSKFALKPKEVAERRAERQKAFQTLSGSSRRLLDESTALPTSAAASPSSVRPDMMSTKSLSPLVSDEDDTPHPSTAFGKLRWWFRDRGRSLCLIPKWHPLRSRTVVLVESSSFETFIIVCIIISSITLALEAPRHTPETLTDVLFVTDMIFLVIFTVEFVLKVIAYGFILGPKTYIRDSWNKLDFIVLAATFASTVAGASPVGRTLRVGRILRPLRVIRRNPSMKVIINALLRSLPAVAYTVVLLLLFFLIFGILGLNLFSGKFYKCNDPAADGLHDCVGFFTASSGMLLPRVWANPDYSFDNIGAGFRTLFEVVTLRDWVPVLLSAMDTTDVDQQPKRDNAAAHSVFFVIFIFIGSFYMLKLFVGIIVAHFRQFSGTALLTPAQQEYLVLRRLVAQSKPGHPKPTHPTRLRLFNIVNTFKFDATVTAVMVIHVIVLCFQRARQSSSVDDTFEAIHWVFTALYTVEIATRLFALGPRLYYEIDGLWAIWDVVSLVLLYVAPFIDTVALGAARALRFSRVVNTVAYLNGTKRLLRVLADSTGAILNVTSLLLLIIFVYSVMGMQLFGFIKAGKAINTQANFETFPEAVLTLFAILGGENWVAMMRDASVTLPECTQETDEPFNNDRESDCGSSLIGPLYFLSFYVLTFAVFLNLYVAAILDLYQSSLVQADSKWKLSERDLANFRSSWDLFRVSANSRSLPLNRMRLFLNTLVTTGHRLGDALSSTTAIRSVMVQMVLAANIDTATGQRRRLRLRAKPTAKDARLAAMFISENRLTHVAEIPFTVALSVLVDVNVQDDAMEPHEWTIRNAKIAIAALASSHSLVAQWVRRVGARRAAGALEAERGGREAAVEETQAAEPVAV